ncbi:MAG: arabinan endo-1,5-alpha-L-arabinosidase, partial [Pirellulales bacterium]|nr:arabinan endo-1,5-alpha-L-arabinosidase [Pirellulales bacterium]
PIYHSNDLVHWRRIGHVFTEPVPAWTRQKVPGTDGIWAPDIVRVNDWYYLYYSCSTFGSQRSVIGLAVNQTLDPADPKYHWEDRGEVIASQRGDSFNAIDPAMFVDRDGKAYLFWGSFWSGIKMIELDPDHGKPKDGAEILAVADRLEPPNAIEAAYVIFRHGHYYLFVSFDACCEGSKSTYRVMIGRSDRVMGPYIDAQGRSLLKGGGTLIIASDERWKGPGHNSILQQGAKNWLVHHTYDMRNLHRHRILQIRPLYWQENGWPVAGEPIALTHDKPTVEITEKTILGTWRHSMDYNEGDARLITLEPGGTIRNASEGSSWKLNGNRLQFRWQDSYAPDGEWIEEVLIEPAGTSYIGRNQTYQVIRGRRPAS